MRLSGLRDKLYWRRPDPMGMAHCFKRVRHARATNKREPKFRSLCGEAWMYGVGTQKCQRPSPLKRCTQCDVAEMKRRGWEESGPES